MALAAIKRLLINLGAVLCCSFFYFLSFSFIDGFLFLQYYFGDVSAEQIFFHLINPLAEANPHLFWKGCALIFGPALLGLLLIYFPSIFVPQKKKLHSLLRKYEHSPFHLVFSLIFLCATIYITLNAVHFWKWIRNENRPSILMEKYFVPSNKIGIQFTKKQNVILIYMESMENSYHLDPIHKENLIPGLTKLEKENTTFTGHEPIFGTDYTAAAIFAGLCGVPLSVPISARPEKWYNYFPPKTDCIPQLFQKEGYSTHYLMGSSDLIGNVGDILQKSGIQNIISFSNLQKNNRINDSTRGASWGMKDSALFEVAKAELIQLSQQKQPFFFGISTIDTHYPDYFFDKATCKAKYNDYADVILCQDKIVSDFINWVQQQPFAKNTTIIVLGDHLAPRNDIIKKLPKGARRSVINIFINPAYPPLIPIRRFTSIDFAPSILSAAGATLKYNAFGVGRNLFSGEPTLYETLGQKFKHSISSFGFYYQNIMVPFKKAEENLSSSTASEK